MPPPKGPGAKFSYVMIAPDSDVDENCHISNIAYVRWVQEATRAHSEAIGWSKERFQETGCFFLIKRHEIDYVSPAEGGDEITITTWVEEFRPASALRISHIKRGDKLLAKAVTEWVFVTIDEGRPTRMLPAIATAFHTGVPTPEPPAPTTSAA